MITDLKILHASLPKEQPVYFIDIPVEDLDIQSIVYFVYGTDKYRVRKITVDQLQLEEELDKAIVLEFDEGHLSDKTLFYKRRFRSKGIEKISSRFSS